MAVIKTLKEIEKLRQSAQLLSRCLDILVSHALPGVSATRIDQLAEEFIRDYDAVPAFKNYASVPGAMCKFPSSVCFSRNQVLVHGVPREDDVIEEGDVLTIDCGLSLDGWFADAARLFGVGRIAEEDQKLIAAAKKALQAGIDKCRAGNKLGDICNAIQVSIGVSRYHNVLQFCGHGIGRKMHEEPQIPNFGKPGEGMLLEPGMVFCLEPMLLKNKVGLGVLPDKWTIVTLDGSKSAHIEHMVAITESAPEILTIEI